MILPSDRSERDKLYRNVIRQCDVSRPDRASRNKANRLRYLTGSDTGVRARYDKLFEHVQFSSAFLYAPAGVRFGITLPPHYGDTWIAECDAAKEELHHMWHNSDAGIVFDSMVTWAHVYDTMVGKVVMNAGNPILTVVPDPADIGVINESLDDWDHPEAICHFYNLEVPRFQRMVAPHKDGARLSRLAEDYAAPYQESAGDRLPATVQRTILLSQASPNMIGAVTGVADGVPAVPMVNAPVVRMAEAWVWDDEIDDYRVATHLWATEDILWDPQNPLVAGEHPFHPLSLIPTPGYIWGMSPMDFLFKLQAWRESKMAQLDDRDDRQIDPPMFFKGFTSITDEQALRFRAARGTIASTRPDASVEQFLPAPVAEPYAIVDRIDTDFGRASLMPRQMQGQQEPGVKAGDQGDSAAMAAGPEQKRAMLVEECLGAIATQMLKLRRRTMDQTLKKQENHEAHDFLLSQMPGDFSARVWAHSASPLYAKSLIGKAKIAFEAKAIDAEDLLEYLDLPMTESKLRAKARKMAEASAKRQEELISLKKAEVAAKVEKAKK